MTDGELKNIVARLKEHTDDFALIYRLRGGPEGSTMAWVLSDPNWGIGAMRRTADIVQWEMIHPETED